MGFYADLERGELGESIVRDYFDSVGVEVRDTSKEPEYQEQDVDMISADGIKYEVKTDFLFHKTGNLALEDSVTYADGTKKSWLWTSEADRFIFVNPNDTRRLAAIDAEDLRHLVMFESLKKVRKDEGYKVISLYLLPYEKYKDVFEILER